MIVSPSIQGHQVDSLLGVFWWSPWADSLAHWDSMEERHTHPWTSLTMEVSHTSLLSELLAVPIKRKITSRKLSMSVIMWASIENDLATKFIEWGQCKFNLISNVVSKLNLPFIVPPHVPFHPFFESIYRVSRHFPVLNFVHWSILCRIVRCGVVSYSVS